MACSEGSRGSSEEWEEVHAPDYHYLTRLCCKECNGLLGDEPLLATAMPHWIDRHLKKRNAWLPLLRLSHAARDASIRSSLSFTWLQEECSDRHIATVFQDSIDIAAVRWILRKAYDTNAKVPWKLLMSLVELPKQPRQYWSFCGQHSGIKATSHGDFGLGYTLAVAVAIDPISCEGAAQTICSWRLDGTSTGCDLIAMKTTTGIQLVYTICSGANATSYTIYSQLDIEGAWCNLILVHTPSMMQLFVNGRESFQPGLPYPWVTLDSSLYLFAFGKSLFKSTSVFQGRLSSLLLFSSPLEGNDLSNLFSQSSSLTQPNHPKLLIVLHAEAQKPQEVRKLQPSSALKTKLNDYQVTSGITLLQHQHITDVLHSCGGFLWTLAPFFIRLVYPQLPTVLKDASGEEHCQTNMIALVCKLVAKNRKIAEEALLPFQFNPSLGTFGHLWARLWSTTTKVHVNNYLVSAVFDATKNLLLVSRQLSVKTVVEPWLYVIFRCENWFRATFEDQTTYYAELNLFVQQYIDKVPPIRHFWLALSHMTTRRLRQLSIEQLGAVRRQLLSIIELIMVLSEDHAKDCHKALEEYLHKSIDDDVLEWWKKAYNLFPLEVEEQVQFWMGFLGDPYSPSTRLKCLEILTICCTKHVSFKLSKIIAHGIVDLLISLPNEYHETIALSLIQLQDFVVVLEFAVQTPVLPAKRLGIGALVANQEEFLKRLSECNNYTPEETLVAIARLGLSLSTKDAEFLAIANGIAQLLSKTIVSIAIDKSVFSQAFMDLAVTLAKQLDIIEAVLTQVLSQCHDNDFDPRYAWTLLTALAPVASQALWCPLWQLWRKVMQPENFAHVTRLAACMGWMISVETLCIDERFVYCGACDYVGLDSICPVCCIPGGDPFGRDLLLVQGPWLEQSNPEALAMRCTLLSALTQTYSSLNCLEKQAIILDKVKYLVYTLPIQLLSAIPFVELDDWQPHMPHLCAILEQTLFQRTMSPLEGLIAKYQVVCTVPQLPPVRAWELLPFPPSPSKVEATESVYGSLRSAHKGIKRLMLYHPIWQSPEEFIYRVDTAEFGAKRLRPRLTPTLKSGIQSRPRHSRLFESLSDPLGSSMDLWRHSMHLRRSSSSSIVESDDVNKTSSVFQAYILLLRPQGNLPGEVTITASSIQLTFHDSKVESKSKETSQIKFLLGRRYLLQSHVALEIFWYGTAAPWFVVFDSSIACKRCYTACQSFALENLVFNSPRLLQSEAHQIYRLITGVNVPTGMEYLYVVNATTRWQMRSMSTFEYLMHVNTAAGRTYNDLNQYFVFPWVEDPTEHQPRDFKLPMGAINPKRLQQCQARAATMTTELIGHEGTPPPFLYGSHYSTTGSVLYFLVRLAPFTQCAKDLQGGKLDHPDRLFHSWNETWTNCLTSSDVKELIPELFYHLDLFYASEDFGLRQNGEKVGDVVLPAPDTVAFIARQQRKLETNEDIPYWINLIFGVLNSGDAAWTANNMFFHLTYAEHAPAISLNFKPNAPPESDPSVEAATTQLLYFGQTPPQVFSASHPLRLAPENKSLEVQMYTRVPCPSPIVWIVQSTKSIQALSLDGVLCTPLEDANVLVQNRTMEMALNYDKMDIGPVSDRGMYYLWTRASPEFELLGWSNTATTEAQSTLLPSKNSVVAVATSPSSDALVIITVDGLMQVWDTLTLLELLFPEIPLTLQLPEASKWSQVTSLWSSMWKEEVVLPPRRRPQIMPYRTFGLGDADIVCASVNLAVDLACTCTSSTVTTWGLRTSKLLRTMELDKMIGRPVDLKRISIHAPESYMIAISISNDEQSQGTMDVIAIDVNGRLLSISSWPVSSEFYFAWLVELPNAPECPPLVVVVTMHDLVLYSVWDCQWIIYSKQYRDQVSYAAVESDRILVGFYSGDVEIVPLDGIYSRMSKVETS